MKALLLPLSALSLLTSSALAQQIDQPLRVPVAFDFKVDSSALPSPPYHGLLDLSWPGSYGAVSLEFEDSGIFYRDVTAEMPVDQEFLVSIMPEMIAEFEVLLTPPPGYGVYIDGAFTPYYSETYPMHGSAFKVQIRRLGRSSGLAAGATTLPEIGRRVSWDMGLGFQPNGRGVGRLRFAVDTFAEIFDSSHLRVEWNPNGTMETYVDDGDLARLRSDILVDVTNLSEGYRVDFYPAGAFSATVDLDATSGLITGNAFRRIEVQKVSATKVELRVFHMNGGTPTPLVEHTLTYDDTGDTKWTLESGDGTTVGRTEVYDFGSGQDSAEIDVKKGTAVARKTYKKFISVAGKKDIEYIEEDAGGKDYTTAFNYNTASGSLQSIQGPDGSWSYQEYDIHGRATDLYTPHLDTSTTPGASTAGAVTELTFGDAPPAASSSASAMLDRFKTWTGPEYINLPTLETVRIGGTLVSKAVNDYSEGTLNSRAILITQNDAYYGDDTADYLRSLLKTYSVHLSGDDRLHAGLPVSEEAPDGTKTAWLHQPGAYSTPGSSTLTGFIPADVYDAGDDAKRFWRTIAFHGRADTSGTINNFASGPKNIIDPIYMEKDKSTIEVTVRGFQGKVIRRETYVFTGSTPTGANLTSNYVLIDWTENEYKGEWGYRLHRSKSIRTESDHYDVEHTYTGGRLASTVNALGQKTTYTYDELGRVVQETLLDTSNNAKRSALTWYNAAGDVTSTAQIPGKLTAVPSSPSSLTGTYLLTTHEYDKGGRLTKTVDAAGVEVRYNSNKVGDFYRESVTEQDIPDPGTTPGQAIGTITATVTERRHLDGRVEKVTGATVERFYTYWVDGNGNQIAKEYLGSAGSARWAQSTSDWLGRTIENTAPKYGGGTNVEQFLYHTSGYGAGKLRKHTAPGRAALLYIYDSLGGISQQGLDVSGNGSLETNSTDRLTEHDTKVIPHENARFLETSTYGFPTNNNATKILLSRSRERLTGFSAKTVPVYTTLPDDLWMNSERYLYDADSNTATTSWVSHEQTFIDPDASDRAVYTATYRRGELTPTVTKSLDGFLQETRTMADVRTQFAYDNLGRQETVTTRDSGSAKVVGKTVYVTNSPLILKRMRTRLNDSPTQLVAEYSYYGNGAIKSVKNADLQFSYSLYNDRGQLTHSWGTASNPVKYVYDDYGARTEMHTYQGGTWSGTGLPSSFSTGSAKTEWVYDAATGLLEEKRDAKYATDNTRKETYSYTAAHQLQTVTRARGGTITHQYNAITGELAGKDYSDAAMTDLVFTYDRLGAMESVTDVTGTRTFSYRSTDRRLSHIDLPGSFYGNSRRLTLGYNTSRLRYRLQMGVGNGDDSDLYRDYQADWARTDGRITQVQAYDRGTSANPRTFSYEFATNSNLISSAKTTIGSDFWAQTTTYHDHENRPDNYSATFGTADYLDVAFKSYDDMGRLSEVEYTGELYDGFGAGDTLVYDYTYTASGRLESALGSVKDGVNTKHALNSRRFFYGYDYAGNQDWSSQWADGSQTGNGAYKKDYTVDATNAFSGIDLAQRDAFTGEVPRDGSGQPVGKWVYDQEENTWSYLQRPGNGTAFEHDFNRTTGNPDHATAGANRTFYFGFGTPPIGWQTWAYGPSNSSPTYDKDGNLLSEGVFTYGYDLENRLTWIMSDAADYMAFKYDYMGRRVEAVFWDYVFSHYDPVTEEDVYVWIEVYTKRYVYDGWHLIAELDATTGVSGLPVAQTYFWGYDISGTIGGAGTIGGLLMIDDGTDQYLPGYDGRGNVSVLVDESDGALVAQFEYDPYGQTLRKEGAYDKIPFRYQTKWDLGFGSEDVVWYPWNHLDYGLRWYRPEIGRFINRDPIGEAGGNNLYEAFGGDPINRYDFLGLDDDDLEELDPVPVTGIAPRFTSRGTGSFRTSEGGGGGNRISSDMQVKIDELKKRLSGELTDEEIIELDQFVVYASKSSQYNTELHVAESATSALSIFSVRIYAATLDGAEMVNISRDLIVLELDPLLVVGSEEQAWHPPMEMPDNGVYEARLTGPMVFKALLALLAGSFGDKVVRPIFTFEWMPEPPRVTNPAGPRPPSAGPGGPKKPPNTSRPSTPKRRPGGFKKWTGRLGERVRGPARWIRGRVGGFRGSGPVIVIPLSHLEIRMGIDLNGDGFIGDWPISPDGPI